METVKIDVPTELLKVANPNATDISLEATRLLARDLFGRKKFPWDGQQNSATRL